MTRKYFNSELSRLKELAAEFAAANPALAPLLNGPLADPDVERFLDALVYQNCLLDRKLGVDFPELIQKLANLILPHFLRPVPATTIVAFTSEPSRGQSVTVPAGTQLASTPVDGTSCRFTTTCDLDVHPVELVDVVSEQTSVRAAEIRLMFTVHGHNLSQWRPESLRFFLADDHAVATELYILLSRSELNSSNAAYFRSSLVSREKPVTLSTDTIWCLEEFGPEGLTRYRLAR